MVVLGQVLKVLDGHTDHVRDVAISTDGTKIVSGSLDKTVRVWSMETGEVLASSILLGHHWSVGWLCWGRCSRC